MNAPTHATSRRRFLTLTGGAVALIPLVNLTGCGSEEAGRDAAGEPTTGRPEGQATPPGGQATPRDDQGAQPQGQSPRGQDQGAQGQGGQDQGAQGQQDPEAGALVRLEESNPQAQALGYKHDATTVDKSAYPAYEQGQLCSNCNLYRPEQGEQPWGGCQIFPGKLVHADGWCSAYVAAQQT